MLFLLNLNWNFKQWLYYDMVSLSFKDIGLDLRFGPIQLCVYTGRIRNIFTKAINSGVKCVNLN